MHTLRDPQPRVKAKAMKSRFVPNAKYRLLITLASIGLAILIGLPLAGLLYRWLCRDLDLTVERRMAAAEALLPAH